MTYIEDNIDEERLGVRIQSVTWIDCPADHDFLDIEWLGTLQGANMKHGSNT